MKTAGICYNLNTNIVAQLHEYRAKRILAGNGIEIPAGEAAFDAVKAGEIARRLGGEIVVKAQIHTTSRAAAGGVRFAGNSVEAEKIVNPGIKRTKTV